MVDRIHETDQRMLEYGAQGRLPRCPSFLGSRLRLGGRCRRGTSSLVQRASDGLAEEIIAGFLKKRQMLIRDGIAVLLEEAVRVVGDVVRVMSDRESVLVEPRLLENILVLWLTKLLVKLVGKRRVCTGWQTGFLVEESEDTHLPLDHVDAGLVIREIDERPVDLFSHVFFLLELRVSLNLRYARIP